jgi:hypothetical protein
MMTIGGIFRKAVMNIQEICATSTLKSHHCTRNTQLNISKNMLERQIQYPGLKKSTIIFSGYNIIRNGV